MQALRFTPWSLRAGLVAVAGRRSPWAGGPRSPLQLATMQPPDLPGPAWARIDVTLGGICASDLKLLHVTGMSPVVTAFTDWRQPLILGHEVVGTVVEAGPEAGVEPGTRVVAEPVLSCIDRGFELCAACAAGEDHRCARAADAGRLGAGHGFGFNERYGGGWAEQLVAPGWRCIPVPETLTDPDAVLVEPLAIAVHAVDRADPPAQRAAVIGPGTLGLCTLMALQAVHPHVETTAVGLSSFADDLCTRFGATRTLHGTRTELLEAAAAATGAILRRPAIGPPVLDGGYDTIFDCVGSPQTIDDALRMLRPGGELVLVATSGRQRVDWTLVWLRELRVTGTVYYAHRPDGTRAFATAVDIAADAPPGDLVTHRFPLDQMTAALTTAAAGPKAGAVKVVFVP